MRQVVVTGLGLATPLGMGVEANWEALLAGRSGIGPLALPGGEGLPCRAAGQIRAPLEAPWIAPREAPRMDRFIRLALVAAAEAVAGARLEVTRELASRTGVVLGVGLGGLAGIETNYRTLLERGPRRVSPFFIPAVIANLAPAQIAMRIGARGANQSVATACASGAHAVGEAFEMIRTGRQDIVVAGGAEAAITPTAVAGFAAMRALSTWQGPPEEASRPFDAARSGFVLAEGAGVLVLEAAEVAAARGAPVHAEVVGYGATADAHHITQPRPDGAGAAEAMRLALAQSGLPREAVGHVNAHATATRLGDVAETRALRQIFGSHAERLAVSGTKAVTGHLLGAAGAVEAIYTVLALREHVVPPTMHLDTPDPECNLDYVPRQPRRLQLEAALCNAFGFGGTNAALLFARAGARG